MVERDPNDDKSVIVEIQGGAGGEEAGLWAGDVYRMLSKLRRALGLQDRAARGAGEGKYTFEIKGDGAYSVFKYEGDHRAQRVPKTESQGRVHTSTATVAVLPEAEDVDVQIDHNDLQVDVYRSSGPGGPVGQHDRLGRAHHAQAVRASWSRCRTRRSQLQNREKAMRVLRARHFDAAIGELFGHSVMSDEIRVLLDGMAALGAASSRRRRTRCVGRCRREGAAADRGRPRSDHPRHRLTARDAEPEPCSSRSWLQADLRQRSCPPT